MQKYLPQFCKGIQCQSAGEYTVVRVEKDQVLVIWVQMNEMLRAEQPASSLDFIAHTGSSAEVFPFSSPLV